MARRYYDYRDKQLQTRYNDFLFGVLDILANIPKSSIKGFELEATARPLRALTVGAAFTYLDATINEYVADNVYGAPGEAGVEKNFAGSRIPYTPKYQGAVNADYQFPVNDGLEGFVGANINMRSATTSTIGGENPLHSVSEVPQIFNIDSYVTVDG